MIERNESAAMPMAHALDHDRDHEHDSGHPLAVGLLAGTAVGVGLGLLLAPRKGSELRHQIADGARHVAETSHDAYNACRDAVSDGATATRRYLHEINETLRGKAGHMRSDAESAAREATAAASEFGSPRQRDRSSPPASRT